MVAAEGVAARLVRAMALVANRVSADHRRTWGDMMVTQLRAMTVFTGVLAVALCPATVNAGPWWSWGHPGYAESYYAPSSSFAAYGPSYSGPSSGCCGSSCGSCQSGYAGNCGCDPCGCNPCGGGCGIACAGGACTGGNCGLNAAPASQTPIPETTIPQRQTNDRDAPARNPDDGFRANPNRTFEDSVNPSYDSPPPRAPRAPVDNFSEPAVESDAPRFPARTPRDDATTPKPFPSRSGTPPAGDLPGRTAPANPGTTPVDPFQGADPGTSSFKPAIPENSTVIPQRKPAESGVVNDGSGDADLEVPPPEEAPMSRSRLDTKITTAPVVNKSRIAVAARLAAPRTSSTVVAKKTFSRIPPRPRNEWSVAPVDQRITRH